MGRIIFFLNLDPYYEIYGVGKLISRVEVSVVDHAYGSPEVALGPSRTYTIKSHLSLALRPLN